MNPADRVHLLKQAVMATEKLAEVHRRLESDDGETYRENSPSACLDLVLFNLIRVVDSLNLMATQQALIVTEDTPTLVDRNAFEAFMRHQEEVAKAAQAPASE